MSNEQKLREALLRVMACEDELPQLLELRGAVKALAHTAPDAGAAEAAVNAVSVLIETHPDNDQYVPFTVVEVGKTYKTRNGTIVKITGHSGYAPKPFRSEHGEKYDAHGRVYGYDDSCRDLVAVRDV